MLTIENVTDNSYYCLFGCVDCTYGEDGDHGVQLDERCTRYIHNMYIYIYIHIHIYIYNVCIYIMIYIINNWCSCRPSLTSAMFIFVFILYMCIHVYTHTCIHIYAYTYIHTYGSSFLMRVIYHDVYVCFHNVMCVAGRISCYAMLCDSMPYHAAISADQINKV